MASSSHSVLTVRTSPHGSTEVRLDSPTLGGSAGPNRRGILKPPRPVALRVQWAAEPDVRLHEAAAGEEEGEDDPAEGALSPSAAAAGVQSTAWAHSPSPLQHPQCGSTVQWSPSAAGGQQQAGQEASGGHYYCSPPPPPETQQQPWYQGGYVPYPAQMPPAYLGWPPAQQPQQQPQPYQPQQQQYQQPATAPPPPVGEAVSGQAVLSSWQPGSPDKASHRLELHADTVTISVAGQPQLQLPQQPELVLGQSAGHCAAAAVTGAQCTPLADAEQPKLRPAATAAATQTDARDETEPQALPAVAASAPPAPAPVMLLLDLPPGLPTASEDREHTQASRHQQPGGSTQRPAQLPRRQGSGLAYGGRELGKSGLGGDVAAWRRMQMEGPGSGATTSGSLSSGLSPRESQPRAEEWDHAEALQALANGAAAYARQTRQQRAGHGPVSSTDALPARLAAQQLGSLAGMSRKVQSALFHSQRVFERQAAQVEHAVLQRCLLAWRGLRDRKAMQAERAAHMRQQVARGMLRRCWAVWRDAAGGHERRQALLRRAASMLARSLLRRCFREWGRQCEVRWWKTQLELRDRQVQGLAAELRHLQARPVHYMARFRLRRWLAAWRGAAAYGAAKRAAWRSAESHARKQEMHRALAAWRLHSMWAAQDRATLQIARRWLARRRAQQVLSAWRAAVGGRELRALAKQAAEEAAQRRLLLTTLHGWRYVVWFRGTAAAAAELHRLRVLAGALQAWRQQTVLAVAREALLSELAAGRARALAHSALLAWQGYAAGRQQRRLEAEAGQLAEDVERLRVENDRLGRVIDSGEWGRERVAELVAASEVLQRERDALLRLVEGLQQQQARHEPCKLEPLSAPPLPALHDATNSAMAKDGAGQHGSSTSSQAPASLGLGAGGLMAREAGGLASRPSCPSSPIVRNKLLVATGSSFNAMVRALKQDLVASGTLQRNPAALYEVDKASGLSLQRLSLTADGGIQVEGLASPDRRGAVFGSSFPLSPRKRGAMGVPVPATATEAGRAAAGVGAAPRGSGELLAAALKLQGLGGRSVALQRRS